MSKLQVQNYLKVLDSIKSGNKKISHIQRDAHISGEDVYKALEVLIANDFVNTYPATDDKRIRVYYELTSKGFKILNFPDDIAGVLSTV